MQALWYAVLMAASSACCLCGNGLLLLVLLLDRGARRETWPLTLSFCLSDLAQGLIAMPVSAHNSLFRPQGYPGDDALCQAGGFLLVLLQLASLHALAWATADRFAEIRFALSYAGACTARRSRALAAAVWLFTALVAALPLLGFGRYGYDAGSFLCAPSFQPSGAGFNVLFIAAGILAPVLAMCCMCACMVSVARKQARRGTFVCNELHCFYVPAKNYIRSAVVMAATVVCLLVCWLPYSVIGLYETLTGRKSPEPATAVATWLVLFTAVLNPWINSMTQMRYRAALRRTWSNIRQMFKCPPESSLQHTACRQGTAGQSGPSTPASEAAAARHADAAPRQGRAES